MTKMSEEIRKALLEYPVNSATQVDTKKRMAAFLSQVSHESAGFTRVEENGNYSAKRLLAVWPKRFKGVADSYAHQPQKILSRAYADRLGNGPEVSGDGYRYRGRGLIQLTGRSNYESAGKDLSRPYIDQPDIVAQPKDAVATAFWFWVKNKCAELADQEDIAALTKRINGGMNGYQERLDLYRRYLKDLG